LEKIAQVLIEKETIERQEFEELLNKKGEREHVKRTEGKKLRVKIRAV
jgi:hypothetical protein